MVNEQPEALRLAQVAPYLEGGERGQWIMSAADELRRLHEAHEWQYTMAGQRLRRIEKLEALNQELLSALKGLHDEDMAYITANRFDEAANNPGLVQARSAIAKAERATP